jgi:hypothetical protein
VPFFRVIARGSSRPDISHSKSGPCGRMAAARSGTVEMRNWIIAAVFVLAAAGNWWASRRKRNRGLLIASVLFLVAAAMCVIAALMK